MEELDILSSGKDRNDNPWARVQKEEGDFILTGFIHPKKELKAGEKVKVPSTVVNAVKWEA